MVRLFLASRFRSARLRLLKNWLIILQRGAVGTDTKRSSRFLWSVQHLWYTSLFLFCFSNRTIADRSTVVAVWQYFSTWEKALYAFKSQAAIYRLITILDVPGAPKLTANSLLAAIVSNYGLDPAVDEAFISILPSGRNATPLDTNEQYMSTQLAGLLGDILISLSTDFFNGYFQLLVRHGQMMTDTSESLQNLEASLAGTYQNTTSSIQPIAG